MNWVYNSKLGYHSLKSQDYLHNEKITLGLFNFFGTIVWSSKGELYSFSSDNLIYSSPVVDLIVSTYQKSGYTICILEIVKNKNLIEPIKRCIQGFLNKNNLKANVILINYKKFINDNWVINKALYDFFNPTYKFGAKSFYCGDEIDIYDPDPWYRLSDLDTQISKSLNFKITNPNQILGNFLNSNFYYILNDLIITCGQEYSGYDMFYESIELDVIHLGMECKMDFFLNRRIYYIYSEIFLEKYKDSKLLILPDEHYVIIGSHPTLKERKEIESKFEKKEGTSILCSIGWFTKYPYQWSSSYRDFITKFDSPSNTGEKWVRLN